MTDKATPVVTDAGARRAADKRRVSYVLQIGLSIAVLAALVLSLPPRGRGPGPANRLPATLPEEHCDPGNRAAHE